MKFHQIIIIYNPKSTGDSERLAKIFAKKAEKLFSGAKIELVPTKFIAHAEEIAAEAAQRPGKTLIVSSSGDGGYHEVVNGLMAGKKFLGNVTSAVLPAGNANDHSRTMHESPLYESLANAKVVRIDLLKLQIEPQEGHNTVRYAHSYAGLGFTPEVARELNKHQLSTTKEIALLLKTLKRFEPFQIRKGNTVETYDSLVFCNINQMAKVLTFDKKNRPNDGRFEIVAIRHKSKIRMILGFLIAAISYVKPEDRLKKYHFEIVHDTPLQLDGEVLDLKKNTSVKVTIARRALKTSTW